MKDAVTNEAAERAVANCLRLYAESTAGRRASGETADELRRAFRRHAAAINETEAKQGVAPRLHDSSNCVPPAFIAAHINSSRFETLAASRGAWAALCLTLFCAVAASLYLPSAPHGANPLPLAATHIITTPEASRAPNNGVIVSSAPTVDEEIRNTAAKPLIVNASYKPRRVASANAANRKLLAREAKILTLTKEATPAREIVTEFLPLEDASFSQIEGGQIMRVELPRSALASFGLPVNADRTTPTVKADVLVGNDGIAHAIRFVR